MKMRWILGGLLTTFSSLAQAQVVYTVNSAAPTALPANNTIELTNPVTTDTLIRVYDSSGVDDSIQGQLVVKGVWQGGTLKVQVAAPSEPDVFLFPRQPTSVIVFGLRNFGGIRFEHPTDPSDTSLRDNSRVAVAVQGDITGDIEAGEVWRIDALQSADGAFGGTISGNITSFGNPTFSLYQVRYVRAGREITGNILATFKGIERVIAGPLPVGRDNNVTGISGNILAPNGNIGSIYSTLSETSGAPTAIPFGSRPETSPKSR